MGRTKQNLKLKQLINQKRVLFIASKNRDYIRISQELQLLTQYSSECRALCYNDKSYFKRMLKLCLDLLKIHSADYDVVFVGFMSQMILPFFRRKWKNKLTVTDFFISVYDTLVYDRKKVKEASLLAQFLWWIDKKTLDSADYVIADTRAHANYFSEEFRVDREKIEVLYLQADTLYYNPGKNKKIRCKEFYDVLYFGSILPLQGVNIVLKAAELLKNHEKIQFWVIGPVQKRDKIEIGNIHYIDWLGQEDLAKMIGAADLCLAGHFAGDIAKAKRTIPGKAYIYQAMRKKMILGDSPANHELFVEDSFHSFVEMGDSAALASIILRKYTEWEQENHAASM